VLWPDHCVQGSVGADFHRDLETVYSHVIIRKGYRTEIDSYSGFIENDKKTKTGLDGYLRSREANRIFTCGLAMDYCVFNTAADGADLGFEVVFLTELTKPVGLPPGSVSRAMAALTSKRVRFAATSALES
jgi:nicotinamidase/pyrazinamidase